MHINFITIQLMYQFYFVYFEIILQSHLLPSLQ